MPGWKLTSSRLHAEKANHPICFILNNISILFQAMIRVFLLALFFIAAVVTAFGPMHDDDDDLQPTGKLTTTRRICIICISKLKLSDVSVS